MKAYELLLLLNPSLDEEARAAVLDKAQGVITADGGVVDGVDSWGKRKLAYEIEGLLEGIYYVVTFTATPSAVAEVERVLGITDDVVRFKTLRLKV